MMRFVVDMNLPPAWCDVLSSQGWPAVHWTSAGDWRATDEEIVDWARTHDHIVFSHDLDFSRILALTAERGPSVLQIRSQDVIPESVGTVVVAAIRRFESQLQAGAIVVVDLGRSRARILPIR